MIHDFLGDALSLGMPADSLGVTTVGAGTPPPFALDDLAPKPDLLAPVQGDSDGFGAAFTAGVAASSLTAGAPLYHWRQSLGLQRGEALRLPVSPIGR